MNITRRHLMQAGLMGGGVLASGLFPLAAGAANTVAENPLKILILGGTGFIGPHMVREALRRGHTVELFNRGRTNNELFPDLVTHKGDRDNGLDALKGKRWDVVIDNSGYVPRHVADSARLLRDNAEHYVYISTISVYADFGAPMPEDAATATIADETMEEVTNETYGPLKALCEQRAASEFGADRMTVLRPTYICGPGDRTDRFTYWPIRCNAGGEMLLPGSRQDPVQIIDVRDLAIFTVDAAERRFTGTYNTVTPPGEFTMGALLDDALAVTAANTRPVWVSGEFLREQGAGGKLPIWAPPQGDTAYIARVSGAAAFAQGLRNRPTRETARDTLRWWKTLPAERTESLRAGLSPDEEAALLAAWAAR